MRRCESPSVGHFATACLSRNTSGHTHRAKRKAMASPKTSSAAEPEIRRAALFSECGRYRYLLVRQWKNSGPTAVFVLLNPSTADGPPTITQAGDASATPRGGAAALCSSSTSTHGAQPSRPSCGRQMTRWAPRTTTSCTPRPPPPRTQAAPSSEGGASMPDRTASPQPSLCPTCADSVPSRSPGWDSLATRSG